MQSYLDRADDRSRSVSQHHHHARANSYDIQKSLLQVEVETPLLVGGENDDVVELR